MEKIRYLFFKGFISPLIAKRTEHKAITPWCSEIFLIFPNFLQSSVISCLETRETTHMYQFNTNNHALFHFWWNENLLTHWKFIKILWTCLSQKFSFPFMSLLTALIVKNSHIFGGIYTFYLSEKNILN